MIPDTEKEVLALNYAGILAGGIGSRMESDIPKQFLKIADVPIIIRTIRTFAAMPNIDKIVLAMNPQWMEYCRSMLKEYEVDVSNILIISGGTSRFLSMVNIVNACLSHAADRDSEDYLCIHDCARPFLSHRMIEDNFRLAKQYDMVTTSIPTIDTILISENGKEGTRVPNRSTIFCDQGPQTFRIQQFKSIYENLTQEEIDSYIEAGRMYMEKGYRVGIVEGDRMNFKITTSFDISFAEFLLQNHHKLGEQV